MTHILAIHAHPDDIETLAAGTLVLLGSLGHRLTIATVTAGDCGSVEHDRQETARIRKNEARNVAAIIGAAYWCAELDDLAVFNDDPSRRRVTELIRSVRPDIVITAAPADYHPDHEATSVLVRDACFAAPVPNYATGSARPLDAIPHLYFMDPIEGRDRDGNKIAPDFAVNVEAQMETKRRMLGAHASQQGWVVKQHGIDDYAGAMDAWTKKRGKSFGVLYAEGFRQYKCHPYPATPLLQELVAGALLSRPV
ncbi:MAG: PIG-L family deacetylase [Rhizomicrobium sp.]|jgi:LmbE family N-acetylglucosaminyl deacetylase